jgi:L-iditol 2-dehydrogenase
MAAAFAPDEVINPEKIDLVAEVKRLTSGKGADVVVTANPVPKTQVQAVDMAKKGGRILLFGGLPPEESRPGVNMNLIHYNALTVMGTTIFAPRHHDLALRMLASGRIDGRKLITHRFPLDEFVTGARLALDGKVLKAVFLP